MADVDAQRNHIASLIEGRSDEDILKGLQKEGVENVLDQIFGGMVQAFQPAKAAGQAAVVQYDVTADGCTHSYQLKVADGKCDLVKGGSGGARTTLTLAAPDFLRLVTGNLNGMQAFMAGKLKLAGDMMFAQTMQSWFAQA